MNSFLGVRSRFRRIGLVYHRVSKKRSVQFANLTCTRLRSIQGSTCGFHTSRRESINIDREYREQQPRLPGSGAFHRWPEFLECKFHTHQFSLDSYIFVSLSWTLFRSCTYQSTSRWRAKIFADASSSREYFEFENCHHILSNEFSLLSRKNTRSEILRNILSFENEKLDLRFILSMKRRSKRTNVDEW